MAYSVGQVRGLLEQYRHLLRGEPLRPREDRLGVQAAPLDEAVFCRAARVKADLELGLKGLPFEAMLLLLMALSLRHGSRYDRERRVGEYFGISGAEVRKRCDSALETMVDSLNGDSIVSPRPSLDLTTCLSKSRVSR